MANGASTPRGNRRVRRFPRLNCPWSRATTALTATLLAAALVIGWHGANSPAELAARSGPAAALRSLIGDNGLVIRPGLSADGGPSWPASAYGLPALALAEGRARQLPDPEHLINGLRARIAGDPVWARWYATQVEHASGTVLPGGWAHGVVEDYRPAGKPEQQVAELAAVADVVDAAGVQLTPAESRRLADELESAAASTPSPYARCRTLQAARELGTPPPVSAAATPPPPIDLARPFSTDTVTDAYGTLCVTRLLGRTPSEQVRTAVLRWLEPQLGMPVAGSEFEAYYLVQAWLAAGGPRDRLALLAAGLRDRIDPGTGLLRQHVMRLGTLENTYYAAELTHRAGQSVRDIAGQNTLDAIRQVAGKARAHGSVTDLLMCAAVLRWSGRPDAALEKEGLLLATARLRGGVTRRDAVFAARTVALLDRLGLPVPPVRAVPFPVRDDEDRFLAWMLLGLSVRLINSEEVRQQLAAAPGAGMDAALAAPDALMVKEVAAAWSAGGGWRGGSGPTAAVARYAHRVQGCPGFPALYRPAAASGQCTLGATVQVLQMLDGQPAEPVG